jgi:AccI restriction endonuclease
VPGFAVIEPFAAEVRRILEGRGVEDRFLTFGGAGDPPLRMPRAPTDARSEFLANRAMGDWAEDALSAAIDAQLPGVKAVHYGDTDRIAAGDEGFAEFYRDRVEGVRVHGKRPDLLVVPANIDIPRDVSAIPTPELAQLVRAANYAIEVRSSKFEANRYMEVKRQRSRAGSVSPNESLSFTVKVEDLIIVYRWMQNYDCTQLYAQVFFDSVYAINFEEIFRIIASGQGFAIAEPAKSQQKATIMIPIGSGLQIGTFHKMPDFSVERRVTELGRHDAFVKPVGGNLELLPDALQVILGN